MQTIRFNAAGQPIEYAQYSEAPDELLEGELNCTPEQFEKWQDYCLKTGEIVLRPRGERTDELRAAAIAMLDTTADRVRAAGRSVGQYLDEEYQLVALALAAYRQSPDSGVPEAIQSYADAEGIDVEAAAQQIAEAAARADERLQAVRRIRLAGKTAIRDAGDDADMLDIARPFIDRLEAMPEH